MAGAGDLSHIHRLYRMDGHSAGIAAMVPRLIRIDGVYAVDLLQRLLTHTTIPATSQAGASIYAAHFITMYFWHRGLDPE